jgi:two-component system phosphate regulon sensor histidine kinase PhoR
MATPLTRGLTPCRLRAVLALLFVLLALPALALVWQTLRQLRWEAYHQYDTLAGELALRIDAELQRLVALEEARSYADYTFLTVPDPSANTLLQRSPLSEPEATAQLPGALGWFQVDADGRFSSPLLPASAEDGNAWGIDAAALAQRETQVARLRDLLAAGGGQVKDKQEVEREDVAAEVGLDAAAAASSDSESGAKVLEQLASARSAPSKLGRVDELQVDTRYRAANVARENEAAKRLFEQRLKSNTSERGLRKEQAAEPVFADAQQARQQQVADVRLFESELDPFQFRVLDAAHGLLYRRVWRDGRRGLQGVVVELEPFLDAVVVQAFQGSALAADTELVIALGGEVQRVVGAPRRLYSRAGQVEGELLHQARLSAPFDDLQLLWSARDLPAGPGARLVGWTALVLFAVLGVGLLVLYRLGLRQLALAAQQRDFVSAVSHELKTPLTSIRMYAEMLRAGWTPEEKRSEYYAFIHDESERLSRLIGNVLQLARLERDELALQPRAVAAVALLDMLRSKVQAQVAHAGFTLEIHAERGSQERTAQVDPDAFVQIMINLVDNALKFAAKAERRVLDLELRADGRDRLEFALRDYGPGVPPDQRQRIFEPFQRGGSELTREAPGTGIGLALARQLARAMGGDLEHRAVSPGAEFVLRVRTSQDVAAAG